MARVRRIFAGHDRDVSDERGFVAMWMAMVVFVLIGISALAVDLVHGYVVAQQAQKAADAAALAGVTSLPSNMPQATSRANSLASQNGFTSGPGTTVGVSPVPGVVNQLKVDVTNSFDTFFAGALGFPKLTVHKSAIAEYDPPVQMGSPNNFLGDVPECPTGIAHPCTNVLGIPDDPAQLTQHLSVQVEGSTVTKGAGNAYSTNFCIGNVDGCSGSTNNQYDPTSEEIKIHTDTPASSLKLFLYDPAFVNTLGPVASVDGGAPVADQFCVPYNGAGYPFSPTSGMVDPTKLSAADAADPRYQPGQTAPGVFTPALSYCAGDANINSAFLQNPAAPPMSTTYWVTTSAGATVCGPATFNGFYTATQAYLDPAAKQWFHKWWNPCGGAGATFTGSTDGDYILHVSTDNGQGANNFSVLAVDSTNSPGNITVSTTEKLPLYENAPNSTTPEFFVARLWPSSVTRHLHLEFFDLGDNPAIGNNPGHTAGDSTGSLSFDTSSDVVGGTSAIAGCQTFSNAQGTSPIQATPAAGWPYWGTFGASTCSFTYTSATWNGQWVDVDVQINGGAWQCTVSDPKGCWLKLKVSPGGHFNLADATTWNAVVPGTRVKLIR